MYTQSHTHTYAHTSQLPCELLQLSEKETDYMVAEVGIPKLAHTLKIFPGCPIPNLILLQ